MKKYSLKVRGHFVKTVFQKVLRISYGACMRIGIREHNDGFIVRISYGIHGECGGIQISDAYI